MVLWADAGFGKAWNMKQSWKAFWQCNCIGLTGTELFGRIMPRGLTACFPMLARFNYECTS